LLAGQPQFGNKLMRSSLSQFYQRVATVSRLAKLTPAETSAYVDHHLCTAGYHGNQLFTPDAVAWIAEKSDGVPREINRICFNGLSIACALQRQAVDMDILRELERDLELCTLSDTRAAEQAASSSWSPSQHPLRRREDFFPPCIPKPLQPEFRNSVSAFHSHSAGFQLPAPSQNGDSRAADSIARPQTRSAAEKTAAVSQLVEPPNFLTQKPSKLGSQALKIAVTALVVIEIAVALVLVKRGEPSTLQLIHRVREQLRTILTDKNVSNTHLSIVFLGKTCPDKCYGNSSEP
jgi:hypothetical protein